MKKQADFNQAQVRELLHQALETERGGIKVYETALQCAVNKDLRKEWEEYLEQTRRHEQILLQVFEQWGLDANERTPGQDVVGLIGESLVRAMEQAKSAGDPVAAELTACECVVLAESKDHLDWELIGMLAGKAKGEMGQALKEAYKQVEDQEDEHLYHTQGWARELWIQGLGLPAVLPPPEEEKEVKTAIGAARAKQERGRMKKAG